MPTLRSAADRERRSRSSLGSWIGLGCVAALAVIAWLLLPPARRGGEGPVVQPTGDRPSADRDVRGLAAAPGSRRPDAKPRCRLSVLDDATGAPIVGARVHAARAVGATDRAPLGDGLGPTIAATDTRGRCSVRIDESPQVVVRASGYRTAHVRLPPGAPEHWIRLEGEGRIAGRVVDASTMQGLAGAEVGVRGGSDRLAPLTRSDASGRFELERLPAAGPLRIHASLAGYASAERQASANDARPLDIALRREQTLVVAVTIERRPEGGALPGRFAARAGLTVGGRHAYSGEIGFEGGLALLHVPDVPGDDARLTLRWGGESQVFEAGVVTVDSQRHVSFHCEVEVFAVRLLHEGVPVAATRTSWSCDAVRGSVVTDPDGLALLPWSPSGADIALRAGNLAGTATRASRRTDHRPVDVELRNSTGRIAIRASDSDGWHEPGLFAMA